MATKTEAMLRSPYAGKRMSVEEYLALPEEKPYLEYVDGVVVQKAVPNRQHRRLVAAIDERLGELRKRHGGDYGPEGRVQLNSGRYRLPDTAYWAPGRPNDDDSIPTLAVEVRSPDETIASQREKCRQYREAGVDVCWLVIPGSRTVEVFEGEHAGRVLGSQDMLSSAHLPGFTLPLEDLFAVLDRD